MGFHLSQQSVVVSGIGFITSIGCFKASVLESLLNLKHGLKPITFFDNPSLPVKLAGTIEGFDLSSPYFQKWKHPDIYSIPKELLRGLPPHGVYAFCAIEQALADAGITTEELKDERTALYCASAGSAFLLHFHLSEMYRQKGARGSPFGVVSTISGTLNFNLGAHYKMRGGNCGFVSACSSSAHALGYALDQIKLGRVDRVIVVGAEDINAESILPFSAMRAMSHQADPCLASCPFDRRRSGFVASGGAVALVLENADHVKHRDSIYGEMVDWAQSSDGYSPAISDPEGKGVALSMRQVIDSVGIKKSQISYINAHATSTVQGDRSEARAILEVMGDACGGTPVSSTKGLTGHPLSMAGAMETAFCMLALKKGFIPANAHLQDIDREEMGSIYLPTEITHQAPNWILKNSSGFGGSNVSLLLKRWN